MAKNLVIAVWSGNYNDVKFQVCRARASSQRTRRDAQKPVKSFQFAPNGTAMSDLGWLANGSR
jgi:hypothetical protein